MLNQDVVGRRHTDNPAKNIFTLLSSTVAIGTDYYNGSGWPIQYWYRTATSEQPLNYYSFGNFIPRVATGNVASCGTIGINSGGGGGGGQLFNLDSISDLFYYYDHLYDSLKSVRTSLVDRNATSTWISNVNAATSGTKATLLSQLASLAPYTSENLLRAILNKTSLFTSGEIATILNQNIHFYIYPTLKDKLIQSWNYTDSSMAVIFNYSTSDYLKLESKISEAATNRFLTDQYIINHFSVDSVNIDSLHKWVDIIPNIENKYMLADLAISQNDFTEAGTVLDDIPNSYSFTTRMDTIHDQYLTWKDLAEDISFIDQDSLLVWIENNSSSLENLGDQTITKPAARARGFLYLLHPNYDYFWYPIDFEEMLEPRSSDLESPKDTSNLNSIYPNPASNFISLNTSVQIEDDAVVYIYDLMGTLIFKIRMQVGILHTFEISKLPPGVYYLSIIKNSFPSIFKFIKTE